MLRSWNEYNINASIGQLFSVFSTNAISWAGYHYFLFSELKKKKKIKRKKSVNNYKNTTINTKQCGRKCFEHMYTIHHNNILLYRRSLIISFIIENEYRIKCNFRDRLLSICFFVTFGYKWTEEFNFKH